MEIIKFDFSNLSSLLEVLKNKRLYVGALVCGAIIGIYYHLDITSKLKMELQNSKNEIKLKERDHEINLFKQEVRRLREIDSLKVVIQDYTKDHNKIKVINIMKDEISLEVQKRLQDTLFNNLSILKNYYHLFQTRSFSSSDNVRQRLKAEAIVEETKAYAKILGPKHEKIVANVTKNMVD